LRCSCTMRSCVLRWPACPNAASHCGHAYRTLLAINPAELLAIQMHTRGGSQGLILRLYTLLTSRLN
jgi:hypothetical protein